jgi:subtilisin-like proprotein convertase family protein
MTRSTPHSPRLAAKVAVATVGLVGTALSVVATAPAAHASAPPGPPTCVTSLTTVSNATPTAIPTGPAVVTSQLSVSGAGKYLTDVDVVTALKHTFSADLDVTLTSPAGTVVTMTTDNGAGNDNVFDGTRWDDDANPGGQVPYTTNDGLVTDAAYVNLVAQPTLAPEEPFAAFIGEDPNGTWTITISDDLAGDGGSLDSWSLHLQTLPTAPNVVASKSFTNSTPTPTVDVGVATSTIAVSGADTYLSDVDVITALQHTFTADLDVTLMSPAGTVVTLSTDNAAGNDNVFDGTRWDDDANPGGQVPYTTNDGLVTDSAYVNLVPQPTLAPEEGLGAFIGENPNGTWTITMSDDLAGDNGTLNSWSLNLKTSRCDTAVTGAGASAKGKQKLGSKKLAIATKVSAASEKLTVTVTGSVKVSGHPSKVLAKGQKFNLAKQTKALAVGQSANLKIGLAGSKNKAKKSFNALKKALQKHQKVTATLTYTFTDERGNTQTMTKKVKLKL